MSAKKYSQNPEDWKFICTESGCDNVIVYDKYDTYRHVQKRVDDGGVCRCASCLRQSKLGKSKLPQIYSRNPEDWTFPCDGEGCDAQLKYTSLNTYMSAICKKKKNGRLKCMSCSQKGSISDEALERFRRNRKATMDKKTPEEIAAYRMTLTIAQLNRWANMSDDDRLEFSQKLIDMHGRMSPEQRQELNLKLSKTRKTKVFASGDKWKFTSGYNKNTIPYIVDILNVKYDTEFRHAESEQGEFKLYDPICKTLYFADAYCKEQNIWIEFDEREHFRGGQLRQKCVEREQRIRDILDCTFLRIKTTVIINKKREMVVAQYKIFNFT